MVIEMRKLNWGRVRREAVVAAVQLLWLAVCDVLYFVLNIASKPAIVYVGYWPVSILGMFVIGRLLDSLIKPKQS